MHEDQGRADGMPGVAARLDESFEAGALREPVEHDRDGERAEHDQRHEARRTEQQQRDEEELGRDGVAGADGELDAAGDGEGDGQRGRQLGGGVRRRGEERERRRRHDEGDADRQLGPELARAEPLLAAVPGVFQEAVGGRRSSTVEVGDY